MVRVIVIVRACRELFIFLDFDNHRSKNKMKELLLQKFIEIAGPEDAKAAFDLLQKFHPMERIGAGIIGQILSHPEYSTVVAQVLGVYAANNEPVREIVQDWHTQYEPDKMKEPPQTYTDIDTYLQGKKGAVLERHALTDTASLTEALTTSDLSLTARILLGLNSTFAPHKPEEVRTFADTMYTTMETIHTQNEKAHKHRPALKFTPKPTVA